MKKAAFDFADALLPAVEKIEKESGEYFGDWYQPIRNVEEFTDIKWTAVQSLMNWSRETGDDVLDCISEFMKDFRAEIRCLKKQGFPTRQGCFTSLEHSDNWHVAKFPASASKRPEVEQ